MESVKKWAEERAIGQSPRQGGRVASYAAEPGTGPEGYRCKDCVHFIDRGHRSIFKCGLVWNGKGSAVSDIRANAKSCQVFYPSGMIRVPSEDVDYNLILEHVRAKSELKTISTFTAREEQTFQGLFGYVPSTAWSYAGRLYVTENLPTNPQPGTR